MAGKTPELTKQAELTKQRFLDAGLEVLRSRGLGSGIDNIRLADVAERLQLSATVAYKIWGGKSDAGEGGQERYRRDLAAHAIENVTRGASESVVAASAVLVQTEASLSEILRVTSKLGFDLFVGDQKAASVLLGLYAAASQNPELRESTRRSFQNMNEDLDPVYEMLLDHYGLQIKEPFTRRDLTTAVSCLADGFALHHGFEPEAVTRTVETSGAPGEPLRDWTIYAHVVAAVTNSFLEPKKAVASRGGRGPSSQRANGKVAARTSTST